LLAGGVIVVRLDGSAGHGAGADEDELRPELQERPGDVLALGVFLDEIKDGDVAVGVLDDAGEILQLQEAVVAVVVLEGLELELGAILGLEMELAGGVGGEVLEELGLVIIIDGRMAERAFAIGPALGVHLEDAEIDAELDFLDAVLARKFPDNHLAGLVIPLLEEV
jgi:hypothetical protein